MIRVLVADGLSKEGIAKIKTISGIELLEFSAIERADLLEKLGGVDVLIVRSRTQVDRELLSRASRVKLVIRAGIGLDNVDIPSATAKGIIVMNAPTGNIVTTAEHAIALLFAVSRKIAQADASMRRGKWEKKIFQGSEIRGKTLGIIGLGNIGRVVANRALGLEMDVVAFDPYVSTSLAEKLNVRLGTFEEVVSSSDYVSLHVPLSDSTRHIFNREVLAKMKKGAFLINCARGGIVDEVALVESLESGHLGGAALDVFEKEPLPAGSALLNRHDVVLTPHLGASTDEAQIQVGLEVAEQILSYVRDGVLKNSINAPSISLELRKAIGPWMDLAEKMGRFAAQIAPAQPIERLRIHLEGTASDHPKEILSLSVLKGYLTPLLSTPVNFVNARGLMKERGVRVEEATQMECEDFAGRIVIELEGEHTWQYTGTVLGKSDLRITEVEQFKMDAVASGHVLCVRNSDRPGVVGSVGSILGNAGVNIARMSLGRNQERGEALALINIDSEATPETLHALQAIPGVASVQAASL